MKTVLVVLALTAAGLYGMAIGLLAWQQRRFLYAPDTRRPDVASAAVPNARAITLHTEDGLDLLAWFAPPAAEAQPVVLYLHGNGGNIGNRAPRLARLSSYGWGALLLEYRGFGGNPGTPTEAGLFHDVQAAYAELIARGIAPQRIILWGESLGTGLAVRLAGEVTVGAVLLESPYSSIMAIGQKQFPLVPVSWLLRDRFDLIGRITAVHVPLLIITGGKDQVVPPAMSQAVFNAANEPKQFWFAPDAGHNNLADAGAFDAARTFVSKHCTSAS